LWEVEIYHACPGTAKVIKKILTHLEEKSPTRAALLLPGSRAHRSPVCSADSGKHSCSTHVVALRTRNRVLIGLERGIGWEKGK